MKDIITILQELTIYYLNKSNGDTSNQDYKRLIEVKNSFMDKLNFITINQNIILNLIQLKKDKIEKVAGQNIFLIHSEIINVSQISTCFLENIIYHMLSSLETLSKLLAIFYEDIPYNQKMTMRSAYNSIKKQKNTKLKDKEIVKLIQKVEYHWLLNPSNEEGIYNYRGNIYHHVSKMCKVSHSVTWDKEGNVNNEKLKVLPPKELFSLFKKDEIEFVEFLSFVLESYNTYILELLNVIKKDIRITKLDFGVV